MATDIPLDREVLAKIGTDALIDFGYSDYCIRQWRRRGVPWKERPKVQELANANGVDVPADFLHQQRAPETAKKAKAKARKRRAA